MSRTIDEKVVEMRFNNQDFERNVSQSMSTLDKLKNALDFTGAEKTFSGLTDAANKLNFGGVGDAIETVGSKFSWLETVATGALLNIGAQIEDRLVNTLKGLTLDQVTAGFDKYADKSKAVQTIMAATGMEIEDVSKQLDRLMWYTDETSYDFSDMVNNVGKFTSAGVDLETAVTAMEGISNLAAISGQGKNEAGRVMYNLSQALSMGAVTLQDWKSIELANMGTKEFREMAIQVAEAQGAIKKFHDDDLDEDFYATYTLDEFGKEIADVEVNWLNFRDTLNEKWFNTDVLLGTLGKYGEFANELNKVYDEINNTDEFEVTTSELIDMANDFAANTLDMDQAMATTGKTAEELTTILSKLASEEYELGRKAFAAGQEARTFKDAIDATKDAVSTQFMRSFEIIFGNYEEAKVLWTDLANELWDIFAGPLSDINKMLAAWRGDDTVVGGRVDLIESIKNIYRALRSYVDPIGEAWEEIFPAMTYTRLREIVAGFKDFTEGLILNEEQMERVGSTFENIFKVIKIVGDFFGGTVKELFDAFTSKAFGGAEGLFLGISIAIEDISTAFENFATTVSRIKSAVDYFKEGGDWLGIVAGYREQYPILTWLVETFDKLKDSLGVLGDLAARFLSINDFLLYYGEAGGGIAGIVDVLAFSFRDIAYAAGDLIKIWTGFDLSEQIDEIWSFVHQFELAIEDIQAKGWFTKIKDDFVGIGTAFRDTFGGFKEFFGPVFEALKTIAEDWMKSFALLIGDGTVNLEDFFKIIDDGLVSLQNFIKTNETLKSIMDGIKDTIKIISDFAVEFLSISDAIKIFQEAGGGLSGIFAVINDKIGDILNLIGTLVKRFTGFDPSEVGGAFLRVLQLIEECFVRLADRIAQLFGWEDNPFHRLLETSESSLGTLQATLDKFGTIGLGGLSTLWTRISEALAPMSSLFDGFKDLLSGAWDLVRQVSPYLGAALSWLGDALSKFGDTLSKMKLSDILELIKTGGMILLIKKLSDVFDGLGDVLGAWETKLKADTLKAIATAILEIAAAAFIIGTIPNENISGALIGVGESFAGLIATIFTAMKLSSGANAASVASLSGMLITMGLAMVEVAAALKLFVTPLKAISDMDQESLNRGLEGVLKMLGELAGMIAAVGLSQLAARGELKEGANAVKNIVVALGLMWGALKLYSSFDPSEFERGFDSILEVLKMLGIFTTVLGILDGLFTKFSRSDGIFGDVGVAIAEISTAMLILAGAMLVLTKVDPGKLAASMEMLSGSLMSLGAVALVLWIFNKPLKAMASIMKDFSTSVLAFAAGVAIVGAVAYLLGDAAEELAKAAVNLIVVLVDSLEERAGEISDSILSIVDSIVDAIVEHAPHIVDQIFKFVVIVLSSLREYIPQIVDLAMDIVLEIYSGVKEALDQVMDQDGIVGAIGIIGIIMASILGVGKITDIKSMLKSFVEFELLLAGAMIVLTEIAAFFYGLGKLSEAIGGAEAIDKFGKVAELLGNIMVSKFGILFGAIMALVAGTAAIMSKLKLKDTAGNIGEAFLILAEVIVAVSGILLEMELLFSGLGALSNKINGAENIENFAKMIESLISFFERFAGFLAIIGGVLIATSVMMSVLPLGGTAAAIGEAGLIIAEVIGVATIIIEAMGLVFAALGGIVAGIDALIGLIPGASKTAIEDGINRFGDICEAVFNVLGRIVGGLAGGIIEGVEKGKIKGKLEGLADGLVYFSQTTKPFFDMMSSMGEGTASAAETFVDMILKLTAAELIDSINILKSNGFYEELADKIKVLGEKIVDFVASTKDLSSDDVEKAKTCMSILIAMSEEIPNQGGAIAWLLGESDMGVFGERLKALGEGLKSFQDSTSGLNQDVIDRASVAVGAVCAMAEQVPNQGSWFLDLFFGDKSLDTFGKNLEAFGESLKNYGESVKDVDTKMIERSSTALNGLVQMASVITTLAEGVGDAKLNFGDIETFGKKIKGLGGNLKDYYKDIKDVKPEKIGNITGEIKEMINEFGKLDLKNSFFDLFESFKSGMTEAFDNQNGIINKFKGYITTMSSVPSEEFYNLKLMSAGGSIASAIAKGFEEIKTLSTALQEFLNELVVFITTTENVEEFNKAGRQLLAAFGDGFTNSSFTATWQKAFNEYLDSIAALITDEVRLQQVRNAGSMFGQAIVEGLVSVDLTPAISQITTTISNGISGIDVSGAVSKVGTNINTALNNINVAEASKNIGNNISAGVAQGMTSNEALSKVDKAAETVITRAEKTTEAKAQVASPSKLFAIIGKFLSEGLAEGIIEGTPDVQNAMASVITAIKDGVSGESLINLMKGSGFNITDSFGASILEASSDMGDYGEAVTSMFADGMFSDLTSSLGRDFMNEILSGMGSSMPNTTAIVEDYAVEFSDSWYDEAKEVFNPKTGEELQNDILIGMGDSLPAVCETSREYADAASNAWSEEYEDNMLSTADYYSDMTIQGPTVTFVADTSEIEEAIDDLVYYYGKSFQKGGELDGYLLAFDLADKATQDAMIREAGFDWGNEDLANALKLRQMQAANAAAADMAWQNMAATIDASKATVTIDEEETITRDDFIRETNGLREDINGMREDIHGMKESWGNADVYLDSGELVGVMAPRLDQEFGNLKKLGERGI